MKRLSRFEWKVVWVMVGVTIAPLLAALGLAQLALRENYQLGLNRRVLGRLEADLSLYKAHLETLRADAEQTADQVAKDQQLWGAAARKNPQHLEAVLKNILDKTDSLQLIEVRDSRRELVAKAASDRGKIPNGRSSGSAARGLAAAKIFVRPLPAGWTVSMGVTAPEQLLDEYAEAGQFVRDFRVLVQGTSYISNRYLAVYSALVLIVIVVALAFGVWGARQVTQRVALLAQATQDVGAGNLRVEVPLKGNDEITALTQAFNAMVRDMRESHGRITYLQRISAWQDVARRMAHEIKNPLTPILLAIQELDRSFQQEDAKYGQKLAQARSIVEEEVATLRRLVNEFSAFAKLPAVHPELVDLGEFVEQATRALALRRTEDPEHGGVEITVDIAKEPMWVCLDAMLMKGCLDNLLINAIEALHAEGSHRTVGQIKISTRFAGGRALIEVEDSGPGVSSEYQEAVFDPYHTTKLSGTGLGLAIVRKVVLEHGGDISYRHSSLGGASFVIHLPLVSALSGSSVARREASTG